MSISMPNNCETQQELSSLAHEAKDLARRLHRSANINKTSVTGWIANMAGRLDALCPSIDRSLAKARQEGAEEMRERAAFEAQGIHQDILKGMSEAAVSLYCRSRVDAVDAIRAIPIEVEEAGQ